LTISAALRYDRDNREQTDLSSGTVREEEFDAVQPKLTFTYGFDDRKLGYFTYSEGFRSGGFNAPGIPADRFEDENLANYEIGVKTSWLNRRLIVNSAIFFTQVDDFQFFFVDAISAAQIIQNIDEVDIFGFELEVQYLLGEGLQVYGGLGTTDSEIKAITVFPGNEGNKTPKTTDVSLNFGLQYRREMTSGSAFFARFDYEHRGHKYWQVDNRDVQDPLDFLNARIGVETGQWGFYFWGKNLTDEKYYTDFNPTEFSGLDVDIGYLGRPRTYGVEASYHF
jgi:iron complex outermembrane receptor protein